MNDFEDRLSTTLGAVADQAPDEQELHDRLDPAPAPRPTYQRHWRGVALVAAAVLAVIVGVSVVATGRGGSEPVAVGPTAPPSADGQGATDAGTYRGTQVTLEVPDTTVTAGEPVPYVLRVEDNSDGVFTSDCPFLNFPKGLLPASDPEERLPRGYGPVASCVGYWKPSQRVHPTSKSEFATTGRGDVNIAPGTYLATIQLGARAGAERLSVPITITQDGSTISPSTIYGGLSVDLQVPDKIVASGGSVPFALRVQNNSGHQIVASDCLFTLVEYGLVSESDAVAGLQIQGRAIDCYGTRYDSGYDQRLRSESGRPFEFEAVDRNGDPLPPGDYQATLKFGDVEIGGALGATRIAVPVTMSDPVAATSTEDAPGLAPRTEGALRRQGVELADAGSALPTDLSRGEAIRAAGGETGQADAAVLARVTTTEAGRQLKPDPTLPSEIDPAVNDVRAWIVVFENVPIGFSGGPAGPPKATQDPQQDATPDPQPRGTDAVIIDAATGEFLYGMQF